MPAKVMPLPTMLPQIEIFGHKRQPLTAPYQSVKRDFFDTMIASVKGTNFKRRAINPLDTPPEDLPDFLAPVLDDLARYDMEANLLTTSVHAYLVPPGATLHYRFTAHAATPNLQLDEQGIAKMPATMVVTSCQTFTSRTAASGVLTPHLKLPKDVAQNTDRIAYVTFASAVRSEIDILAKREAFVPISEINRLRTLPRSNGLWFKGR